MLVGQKRKRPTAVTQVEGVASMRYAVGLTVGVAMRGAVFRVPRAD